MKTNLLLLLLYCTASGLFAQPVITRTDLLQVGDVVITQPCATNSFIPGGNGTNQSWDFSQLPAEGPEDTTFYILPAGTPYAANYPSSNIVSKFGSDQYGYYQITSDKLSYWGQQDPTTSLLLTNPATYFSSPTTYGTFLLDTITGSLSSGALNGMVTGQVFYEGDGYGTLITPGGQFDNVLRIKTVTVAAVSIPFFGTITDSVFNYSWYKLGVKSPVLEMIEDTQWSGSTVIEQVRYVNYFRSITTEVTAPAKPLEQTLLAYPNPAREQVRFSGFADPIRILIQNLAGQSVLDATIAPNDPVSITALKPGLYLCSLYGTKQSTQVLKLLIQ